MSKKRIAVVSKYFYPVAAGIETNVQETYTVLEELGWDITIHTSVDTLTEKNVLPPSDVIRGVPVKRYQFGGFIGYWPVIDWEHTDVVALHNFNLVPHLAIMLYALYLKLLGKKKFALVLTPHGGFNPEWSVFPKLQSWTKQVVHYTLGTWLVNHAVDGVRAVSRWEGEEMIKKGIKREKVVVIDNGIEDEAYANVEAEASEEIKKKVEEYGRYIIQIGRIYVIKNYETTIRAMTQLPEDVKYIIAGPIGSDSYLAELKALIAELGLQDRVIFHGVVRKVDKYYLIKKAQLMVHMAIWESFCNVVHEGLSQGLVCVVANNSALPYLVKDGVNGYCVETKDSDGVAEKMNYILANKNSEEIKAMEVRNAEYGLENSWRKVAGRMNDFYIRLIGMVKKA
jgi:glycosyltransferase involved in cell wall biosynthesis